LRLPGFDVLADLAGGHDRVAEAIGLLADRRAWALGSDGEIVLAHPFATRSFGYSVMSDRTLWWGGCCWDAFAIPHLVPDCDSVIVAGSCPACERAMAWRVDTTSPPAGPEGAHFLVPTARMWEDVIHTCSNQLLFCDDACIDAWLAHTGHAEGYRMDLATLWRFAAGWYAGRLDRRLQTPRAGRGTVVLPGRRPEGRFLGAARTRRLRLVTPSPTAESRDRLPA
jgi:hypothetical protein